MPLAIAGDESKFTQAGQSQLPPGGAQVGVAIDGKYRGQFVLTSAVRPETEQLFAGLGDKVSVALLSGDNDRERQRFIC